MALSTLLSTHTDAYLPVQLKFVSRVKGGAAINYARKALPIDTRLPSGTIEQSKIVAAIFFHC
jgi:hypothetical protein